MVMQFGVDIKLTLCNILALHILLLQDYSGVLYYTPHTGQIRAPVEAAMFAQKNDVAPA